VYKQIFLTTLLVTAGCRQAASPPPKQAAPAADSFADYFVEVKPTAELTMVQVSFRSLPATQDVAARIVRKAINDAVVKDGSKDILAMAFDKDDSPLSELKYGGPLVYVAKDRKIMRKAEYDGIKSTATDAGRYFLKLEENKTYRGIKPERKWLTCSVVFASQPSAEEFKSIAVTEIEKLKGRELDISVYAFVGDKTNEASWSQLKSSNGKYMVVEFKKDSGSVTTNWD
jgi:hypothetical protein